MTTVLLFASLREAAGAAKVQSDATTVAELVAELCQRYGEPFTTRMGAASVVVDGTPVARDADHVLGPTTEVALLPPFSGGCAVAGTGSPYPS